MGLKVAVVGGGNGSYAAAAHLAAGGHEVSMWPGDQAKHSSLFSARAIRMDGLGKGTVGRPACVSSHIGQVVAAADVVIAVDPAFTQESRAGLLAPWLEDGQVVLLSPGSLGGYVFTRAYRAAGGRADIVCAEPGTLPYLVRRTSAAAVGASAAGSPATEGAGVPAVFLSGRTVRLPVGVFPARHTAEALRRLNALYPEAHGVEDALSVALLNVGPIIHSVLVLLNMGPIESLPTWDIHNEGSAPSVKRLVLRHDLERVALRQALDYAPPHYPFADHYAPGPNRQWMYGDAGHRMLVKGEKWREKLTLQHRYVLEDVRLNLALQASVGRWSGTPTPIMQSLLVLFGGLLDVDLARSPRTLEALGLAGMTRAEVRALLAEGL